MDKKDIELFRKAKKEQWVIELLKILAMICLLVLMYFENNNSHDYSLILAFASFMLLISAMGGGRWVATSKEDLIKAMERMINSDAEALRHIAENNKKQNQFGTGSS